MTLKEDDIEKIATKNKRVGDILPQQVKLSIYFKDNIWPAKKNEYLVIS